MLSVFQNVLRSFVAESLEKGYEMLLEADVMGWIFHILLTQPSISPGEVHLSTRVLHSTGFFDLVIGQIQTLEAGRPCIRPELVVEAKIFPRIGFTDQQHRVHFEHILNDDLRKLGTLSREIKLTELIVDGRGYLSGTYRDQNRLKYLINKRDEVAPSVHLFIIHRVEGRWKIAHEAPTEF